MLDSAQTSFACSICGLSFSRSGHLMRHKALHTGVRPFRCNQCPKTFTRRDGLTRHQVVHDGSPNLLQQGKRACSSCAHAKAKCCGSMPCLRCKRQCLPCRYPSRTNRLPESSSSPHGYDRSPIHDVDVDDNTLDTLNQSDYSERDMSSQLQTPISLQSSPAGTTMVDASLTSPENLQQSVNSDANFLDPWLTYGEIDDNGFWKPDVLSMINWLPVELLPDMQMDMSDLTVNHAFEVDTVNTGIPQVSQDVSVLQQQAQPFNFSSQIVTTEAPSVIERAEDSDLYVDAHTTRRPKIPFKRFTSFLQTNEIEISEFDLTWPTVTRSVTVNSFSYISHAMADALQRRFHTLCLGRESRALPFSSTAFLERQQMDDLIEKYFSHFHEIMPFLHKQTCFQRMSENSIDDLDLLLAMQTLGSIFIEGPSGSVHCFQASLFEFLQRALLSAGVTSCYSARRAQCLLMLAVASHALPRATVSDTRLHVMNELRLFVQYLKESLIDDQSDVHADGMRLRSIIQEEALRTGWFIWLFSVQSARPNKGDLIPLSWVVDLPLPHDNEIWTTGHAHEWSNSANRSSLLQCLHELYVSKGLSSRIDNLTSILLTYAVINRTWEAEANLRQPLSGVEPSAQKKSFTPLNAESLWPPADPTYAKWRNSACDCFDILHWRANAAIGMANGYEPTRVLHLHLARLLTCSPIADVIRMACTTAQPMKPSTPFIKAKALRAIQRWAILDQYKARLAAIHAGVTQWHIRRFSVNAYYEPFAIACATMTLWALSLFQTEPTDQPDHESRNCDTILIDRPTDDELVQQFVREGPSMRVVMTGVSNLWDSSAPNQILEEGKRLISVLGAWPGEARHYISLLDNLAAFEAPVGY